MMRALMAALPTVGDQISAAPIGLERAMRHAKRFADRLIRPY